MMHGYGILNNHVPTLKATVMKIGAAISTLLTGLYAVYKASSIVTTLNTSIFRVYNGDNVNDTSGNAQNGTNVGSVTFTSGKIGNAFTFNGSNYISLPDNSLNFTGDFSVSCWVKIGLLGGSKMIVGNLLQTPVVRGWRLEIAGTVPLMDIYDSVGRTTLTSGTSLSLGTWYHIVMTRKSSTQTRIFINGVSDISNTDSRNPANDTTMYTTIGVNQYGSSNFSAYFNGSIDGLTVWNKVLTGSEVTALYNGASGLEYPFSTAITIDSANDSLATYNGTAQGGLTYTTGKSGNAFTFNGTTSYVSLPTNSFKFNSDFSISTWVNLTTDATQRLICNYIYDGTNEYGWWLQYTGVHVQFQFVNSTGAVISSLYNYSGKNNAWHHVTITKKLNGNLKLYINGALETTNTTTDNPRYATTHYPAIGVMQYNSTTFTGFTANGSKIDEVNIWDKELTSTEVTELYNASTGKFYPY